MGQKVHPISFRLGITEDWRSRWYARKKQFGGLVVADKRLRDFIKANYAFALISRIDVERTREQVRVTLYCGRPGVIIGRKGSEVDRLRARLEEIVGDKVDINIVEIHHPEMDAQLVAEGIAEQLCKRASFKRTVRKAARFSSRALPASRTRTDIASHARFRSKASTPCSPNRSRIRSSGSLARTMS